MKEGIPSKSSKSSSSGSGTDVDAVCLGSGLLAGGSSFMLAFERDSVRPSASSDFDAMFAF